MALDASMRSDDLDDETFERRLVHELATIVGAVGEQVIDSRPSVLPPIRQASEASYKSTAIQDSSGSASGGYITLATC
jgi:hypothetical protein